MLGQECVGFVRGFNSFRASAAVSSHANAGKDIIPFPSHMKSHEKRYDSEEEKLPTSRNCGRYTFFHRHRQRQQQHASKKAKKDWERKKVATFSSPLTLAIASPPTQPNHT